MRCAVQLSRYKKQSAPATVYIDKRRQCSCVQSTSLQMAASQSKDQSYNRAPCVHNRVWPRSCVSTCGRDKYASSSCMPEGRLNGC
jgi:hypothetical protein